MKIVGLFCRLGKVKKVGVATHDKFPDNFGKVFSIDSIVNDKKFTVHTGPFKYAHDYLGGGKVFINTIRPFDGKVVYFDDLFYTIGKIKITNPGSGYNEAPKITIDAPSTAGTWGVKSTAVSTLIGDHVDEVQIVSNGRGYTSLPSVTFSSPDVGINTATRKLTQKP